MEPLAPRVVPGSATVEDMKLPGPAGDHDRPEEPAVADTPDQRAVRMLTALMDVVLVLAVLLLVRLVIGFFSAAAITPAGAWYLQITSRLVPPVVGDRSVITPYGGVFSVDTGIVIFGLLFIEWVLASARRRLTSP